MENSEDKRVQIKMQTPQDFDFKALHPKLQAQITEQKADAERKGWIEIEEQEKLWGRFGEFYDFMPSTLSEHWPGIKEPSPSVTFSIAHYYSGDESAYLHAVDELEDFYLRAFRNVLTAGDKVMALDWQHPCFLFDPFREFTEWPISAFPNGDYYIFLRENMSAGFFGHPWEGTICVMGQEFVDQLSLAPEIFTRHKIRENGKPV